MTLSFQLKSYSIVKDKSVILKELFLLFELEHQMDEMENILIEKLFSEQWLWARAAYFYYTDILGQLPVEAFEKLYNWKLNTNTENKEDVTLGKLHLVQIFSPHLSFDNIDPTQSAIDSIIILRSLSHCNEIEVQIAEVYGMIKKLKSESLESYFHDV